MDKDNEQRERLAIARHYDNQLWALPAGSFLLLASELRGLNGLDPFHWKTLLIVVSGCVASYLLLLIFIKGRFQQRRAAMHLREAGELEMASYISTHTEVRDNDLGKLSKDAADYATPSWEVRLLQHRASAIFKYLMLGLCVMHVVGVVCIVAGMILQGCF